MPPFDRGRGGQVVHSRFGRPVLGHHRPRLGAAARGDVDNAAAVIRHGPRSRLHGKERPLEIEVDNPVPLPLVDLDHGPDVRGIGAARIVDPARNRAKTLLRGADDLVDRAGRGGTRFVPFRYEQPLFNYGDPPPPDMAANTDQLGQLVAKAIEPTIAAYGLTIPEFYIENISLRLGESSSG